MGVYVISDLHFNHPGILRMERTQFKTVDEHNEYVIQQYNSVVGPEDTCYILGDVGFYNVYDLALLTKRLNGKKILIMGNHDRFTTNEAISILGFTQAWSGPRYYNEHVILSHEPAREAFQNPYVYNVCGHLHNNSLDPVALDNFIVVSCHLVNYKPQPLDEISKLAFAKCKSRQETFGKEWYYGFYTNIKK